jgi:hypothetical protein
MTTARGRPSGIDTTTTVTEIINALINPCDTFFPPFLAQMLTTKAIKVPKAAVIPK